MKVYHSRNRMVAAVFVAVATGVPWNTSIAQTPSSLSSDTLFRVAANAVIEITVRSNDLIIRGSDRTTADIRADRRDYQLRSSGVNVTLTSTANSGRGRDEIVLLVPRSVRLVIHGVSGDVNVADMTADVEVHVHSGDIVTQRLGGRAILESVSGDIAVTDGVGDLRASTVSGDLVAQNIRGTVEANSTSGDIALSAIQFSRAEVVTNSGEIVLTGVLADDANIQLSTHSGDIALRIPDTANGQLSVSTFRGTVVGDRLTLLPTPDRSLSGARNDADTRRYEFGGGGSARITVSTFTGDVTLTRGSASRFRRE